MLRFRNSQGIRLAAFDRWNWNALVVTGSSTDCLGVSSLAFDLHGDLIASGGDGGTIQLWAVVPTAVSTMP